MLSERMENANYVLTLQGRAGATYEIGLRGPAPGRTSVTAIPAEAATPASQAGAPDLAGFAPLSVTFPAAGGDDDGYVTLKLVIGRKV